MNTFSQIVRLKIRNLYLKCLQSMGTDSFKRYLGNVNENSWLSRDQKEPELLQQISVLGASILIKRETYTSYDNIKLP